MTRAEWERLKTLVHGALEQPAAVRRAWLAREAGGDEALADEAEALVNAHETAGGFLEEPANVDPDDLFDRPTRLGHYRIVDEIGRGGMGIVYLAEDERLGRLVAVKSLPPALADDRARRERLRREARAAATISHPSVASVYALEEIDGQLLLVTEYVPGRTLRDEIQGGPLAPGRALAIAGDVARALAAAHEAGVIHRDLKPENVLMTAEGAVKVVDFGIAYVEAAGATRHTRTGDFVGTPAYMAPEQLMGARGDARADIYALGIVLAEMVTGRHPLAATAGERSDVPGPSMPAPVARIVERCLQPDAAARYASARELLPALIDGRDMPVGTDTPVRMDTPLGMDTPVAGDLQVSGSPPSASARWWWEFHQGMAALAYWLMLIPAWTARGAIGGRSGRVFFILTLAAVIVAATLRLHLWFTARFYPDELRWLRPRVGRWIRVADWLFAVALVAGGLLIGDERALAIVLLSVGIGAAVAFLAIERATTRAAFRGDRSDQR